MVKDSENRLVVEQLFRTYKKTLWRSPLHTIFGMAHEKFRLNLDLYLVKAIKRSTLC